MSPQSAGEPARKQPEVVRPPGEGAVIRAPGHPVVVVKLGGEDTGGAYSLLEMTIDREGPPLHIHHAEEETFYVLEGEIQVRAGDRVITARPGALVLVPRGTPHTFWNSREEPSRLLVVFSPAGYEGFFREVAQLPETPGAPGYQERVHRIRTRYRADLAE